MVFRKDATQLLRSENPDHFRTRQVVLNEQGVIRPYGPALDFPTMQTLRQRGVIDTLPEGRLFANLGVSLQLIIHHRGRRALVLVPQNGVLKLVSGYVPEDHLADPLRTAWAEMMEEVLPVTEAGELYGFALTFEQQSVPLLDPYELSRSADLTLSPTPLLPRVQGVNHSFSEASYGAEESWPLTSYQDESVACLQLVFPIAVELPDRINLFHVDDVLDSGSHQLLSTFDPDSRCVLMALDQHNQATGGFFTLLNGAWQPFDASAYQLSEAFTLLNMTGLPTTP